MNYKKIIKNRTVRIKIMQMLSFIPDKWMIKLQYKIKTGRRLNLENPERFTEKLQWYKLYYRNLIMKQCVDKFDVRDYVKKCGLESILNECYGVFNTYEEIDFDKLPNQFVLKDTLGGGGNSVIVVNDKDKMNTEDLKTRLNQWIAEPTNVKHPGREWVYDNKAHRIIVEKYLEQVDGDLIDYKFFCFNGKVKYIYVRNGYAKNHEAGQLAFFDRELNYLEKTGFDYCQTALVPPSIDRDIMEKMILVADKLATEFPHVRVDLYDVEGKIIFGELTFFNASGYMHFEPDSFDFEMGESFKLPKKNNQ